MSDDTLFGDSLSDIESSSIEPTRDLEKELFGKRQIKDLLTNFEQELGIAPGNKKAKKIVRKAEILSPSKDEDAEKLNQILNEDAKYNIVMWKDTWTVHGDYRIFIIYEEAIDDKKRNA